MELPNSHIQMPKERKEPNKKKAERMIWVTFQKEGVHSFPAAATDPKLSSDGIYDVSFLAHPHRHIFYFKISIEVYHDDREIEFIQFKRWVESLYYEKVLELNNKSCEMIADELYEKIEAKYPNRKAVIEISEDGENGVTALY